MYLKGLIVCMAMLCVVSCETKLIGCEKAVKVVCIERNCIGCYPICTVQLSDGKKFTQPQYMAEGDMVCVYNTCYDYDQAETRREPCYSYQRCGCTAEKEP